MSEEEEREKYLFVFVTFHAFESFKRAFAIDPQINHETLIGSVLYDDTKQFDITVIRTPDTLISDVQSRILIDYDKILIIDKHSMISDNEIPHNWYCIKSIQQLEDVLHIVLTTEQSFILSRTTLPSRNRVHVHTRSIQIPMPMIHILHQFQTQLIGYDMDQMAQHAPTSDADTRVPLNSEWAAKIDAVSNKEEQDSLCVVCLTNDPCIMLSPCAHQCICDICVKELLERSDQKKQCPVCREPIKDIFKPIK